MNRVVLLSRKIFGMVHINLKDSKARMLRKQKHHMSWGSSTSPPLLFLRHISLNPFWVAQRYPSLIDGRHMSFCPQLRYAAWPAPWCMHSFALVTRSHSCWSHSNHPLFFFVNRRHVGMFTCTVEQCIPSDITTIDGVHDLPSLSLDSRASSWFKGLLTSPKWLVQLLGCELLLHPLLSSFVWTHDHIETKATTTDCYYVELFVFNGVAPLFLKNFPGSSPMTSTLAWEPPWCSRCGRWRDGWYLECPVTYWSWL